MSMIGLIWASYYRCGTIYSLWLWTCVHSLLPWCALSKGLRSLWIIHRNRESNIDWKPYSDRITRSIKTKTRFHRLLDRQGHYSEMDVTGRILLSNKPNYAPEGSFNCWQPHVSKISWKSWKSQHQRWIPSSEHKLTSIISFVHQYMYIYILITFPSSNYSGTPNRYWRGTQQAPQ